jgi:hypothetical protein
MGRAVAHKTQSISERGQIALGKLQDSGDLGEIERMIQLVRDKDAGFRGAAPFEEAINQAYRCGTAPEHAVIVAVDGSQVYPDFHAAALYYMTNIGIFVYYHGGDELPLGESDPYLYYADADLRERNGHGALIKNTVVNARRDVQEIQVLARVCWDHQDFNVPLIGVMDGPLLWWLSGDVPNAGRLTGEYYTALESFHDLHNQYANNASLIGYVERGDSRFVIRLLHLLTLADEDITRNELDTSGPFEGLTDDWLFARFLKPGERSAVMIQQSPQNRDYKKNIGDPFEIAFFYLNAGLPGHSHIVRIEAPMWVAQNPAAIDQVHSLMLDQCSIAARYPYLLTRAHELAVITGLEKRQLDDMINTELFKNQQVAEKSPKLVTKEQTRAGRKQYKQPTP